MRRLLVVITAVVFVLGAVGAAHATGFGTLTHQATQNYWSGGGTTVTGCVGAMCGGKSNLTFGDATGIILWEMQEKVWYDEGTNLTTISYTVFNDNIDSTIASFFVFANTNDLVNQSNGPAGWLGGSDPGIYGWLCVSGNCDAGTLSGGTGIAAGESQDTMIVQLDGQVVIGFNFVFADLGSNHNLLFPDCDCSYDWVGTSVVPEPASLSLLGFGLLGLAGLRRRYLGR